MHKGKSEEIGPVGTDGGKLEERSDQYQRGEREYNTTVLPSS